MISLDEYFGPWLHHPDATDDRMANADKLLNACDELEAIAREDGVQFPVNPATNSNVSGKTYGGFRPQSCPQGAAHSSHKEGLAVDRFDPQNHIDEWCLANLDKLEQCGIYIEDPDATPGWSHWTIKAPGSGHRVFIP